MKYLSILVCSTFLFFASCGSDDSNEVEPEEPAPTEEPAPMPVASSVTYDADIAPLISSRCFRCHNDPTANGAPRGATFVNFGIVSRFAGAINFRVGNGTMPPGNPLPQAERDLISQWISDGMLER